jgi:prepilin-type N-terminal cleavage/methylation domain-containing protein/prepilin-type processing-associated H-X9-DG protein
MIEANMSTIRHHRPAFTLVELMVVIGIIAILIGLLLPSLQRARNYSRRITCQANLRSVGQLLLIYANHNQGWIYPVGPGDPHDPAAADNFCRLGSMLPPKQRWPNYVEGLKRYDHPLLRCPSDQDPIAWHSYPLNWFLAQHHVRFNSGSVALAGLAPTEAVVMGEKRADTDWYYIGALNEYRDAADPWKHDKRLGCNYLFLDLHVAPMTPKEAPRAYDPWEVAAGN